MKLKDVTAKCKTEVRLIKENSPWKNSKIKIYDSKTSRFIHEINKKGQVVSISRGGGYVTEKEMAFAVVKMMRLGLEDVHFFSSPRGVLYIKEKDETYLDEANSYH